MRRLIAGLLMSLTIVMGLTSVSAAYIPPGMSIRELHQRERTSLEHVAIRIGGETEGCHVYGKLGQVIRCHIDVPLVLQPPLSGYTQQTYAASWIPRYGVYWTTVSPMSAYIFSDER